MKCDYLLESITDQISKLRSRGMSVDNATAKYYLSSISFQRLEAYIVPLKRIETSNNKDLADLNFDDVISLYKFDRKLRLIFLNAVEWIEVSLRTQWSLYMTKNDNDFEYLNEKNYHNKGKFENDIKRLLSEYMRAKDDDVRRYQRENNYSLPPAHMAAEIMSFGLLSFLVNNSKVDHNQQTISNFFGFDSHSVFSSIIQHIRYVRNISAHHGRLWNRRFVTTMIVPKKPDCLVDSLHLVDSSNKKSSQINFLYNSLVVVNYILRVIMPESEWKDELMKVLEASPVPLTEMGFPEDWKERPVWRSAEASDTQV